jgi:hypothetical protein
MYRKENCLNGRENVCVIEREWRDGRRLIQFNDNPINTLNIIRCNYKSFKWERASMDNLIKKRHAHYSKSK